MHSRGTRRPLESQEYHTRHTNATRQCPQDIVLVNHQREFREPLVIKNNSTASQVHRFLLFGPATFTLSPSSVQRPVVFVHHCHGMRELGFCLDSVVDVNDTRNISRCCCLFFIVRPSLVRAAPGLHCGHRRILSWRSVDTHKRQSIGFTPVVSAGSRPQNMGCLFSQSRGPRKHALPCVVRTQRPQDRATSTSRDHHHLLHMSSGLHHSFLSSQHRHTVFSSLRL